MLFRTMYRYQIMVLVSQIWIMTYETPNHSEPVTISELV